MKQELDSVMLKLAMPKISIVGSSTQIVDKAKSVLCELAGTKVWAAENLGVDFQAG